MSSADRLLSGEHLDHREVVCLDLRGRPVVLLGQPVVGQVQIDAGGHGVRQASTARTTDFLRSPPMLRYQAGVG
jgi:hypothetical protein